MNGPGQSDRFVVPANPPNKAAAAEAGEERERTKGNTAGETRPGRSAGPGVSSELGRVRQVAQRDKDARFTALLHHVSLERLVMAYRDLSPKAAPGVDGVTWESYGQDLVANLRDLHARVQQGRYRASPSRRAYIPKADGRQRPLGIATLEDKIVQRAVAGVLNAVYEADFRGFSYGFRPGRGPHQALDALTTGITTKKVNWVLDADIRDFFGQLDRDWLMKFLRAWTGLNSLEPVGAGSAGPDAGHAEHQVEHAADQDAETAPATTSNGSAHRGMHAIGRPRRPVPRAGPSASLSGRGIPER